ncbi:MAG: acyl-CoA dehydrogenase family protein [Betaproteobacteria bacterium]|nr:MAG: acyl-CoA dehydrogenase family protein [Betaproteobacteria bacterium]
MMTVTETTASLLRAVEKLQPLIAEHNAKAESERQLSKEVYEAMFDANLYAMLTPKAYGGLELHPFEAMLVWEAVSRIDSAAGWNLAMNGAITGWFAWLPADGANEILADGPTTAAGALFPNQPATRVDGGWRVTGQVPFASGCTNSKWLAIPAVEMDGDEPKVDPETGEPAPFGIFFSREEAQIRDTWHTVGMRGTGSADIVVENLFVPDRRSFVVKPLERPAPGFEGPLYRMVPWLTILGEATVSVGVAAAAVDALVNLAQTKTPAYNTTPLREQQLAQFFVAKAKAKVEAARDTLCRAAEEAYEDVRSGSLLSRAAKIRLQLAVSFAAEVCAEAVRLVCDGAGSSSIRTTQPFERYLRDSQVLTQHSDKSSPRYMTAGRLIFGLENDWVWLSF